MSVVNDRYVLKDGVFRCKKGVPMQLEQFSNEPFSCRIRLFMQRIGAYCRIPVVGGQAKKNGLSKCCRCNLLEACPANANCPLHSCEHAEYQCHHRQVYQTEHGDFDAEKAGSKIDFPAKAKTMELISQSTIYPLFRNVAERNWMLIPHCP